MSPTPRSPRPTSTEQAMLLAAVAFAPKDSHAWREVLGEEWKRDLTAIRDQLEGMTREEAIARLRAEHAAQARPDLSRVHVGWWLRALAGESSSVRAAVAESLPPEQSGALRRELSLADGDTKPDRPPHPVASRALRAIWAGRFVGDVAEREDDPPVIVALTRNDPATVARLIHAAGEVKRELESDPFAPGVPGSAASPRSGDVFPGHDGTGEIPPTTPNAQKGELRGDFRLGLRTIARLLAEVEPHRTRWALQHLPYATANALRKLMGHEPGVDPQVASREALVLRTAWDRLRSEGGAAPRGLGGEA